MNAHLLYRDKDFNIEGALVWNEPLLEQDLGLKILFDNMAGGNELLYEVTRRVMLSADVLNEDTIHYRQEMLRDSLANKETLRAIYNLAIEAMESRKTTWFSIFTRHASSVLSSAVGMMNIYLDYLQKLRDLAGSVAGNFYSEAFGNLFFQLQNGVPDEYIRQLRDELFQLKFKDGILTGSRLGLGNKGVNVSLYRYAPKKRSWLERLFAPKMPGYTFQINPRDESGARAISRISDLAVKKVSNIIADADEHIQRFFTDLRNELAFCLGAIHLEEKLKALGMPVCYPDPSDFDNRKHTSDRLYDPCLALSMGHEVGSNNLSADGKKMIIVTGANRGGKSTFLRSLGVAQLMMQSGMFVAAENFGANLQRGVITHFKREEDSTMESGKFDEELKRMDDIASHLSSPSLLLFNESFGATNEREGSEVARQIIDALMEAGNKVVFVTHQFTLSGGYYRQNSRDILFMRADGSDDFKLKEEPPQKTSNGIELYHKIFK